MLNSSKGKPLINVITHKEIQLLFGITKLAAMRRLTILRSSAGRKSSQKLTVIDFCKEEGISIEDFDKLMQRA